MSKHYEVHILKHKHPEYPTNYVIYYLDVDKKVCDCKIYCMEIKDEHLDPKNYFSWFRNNHFSIIDERSGSPIVVYTRPPVEHITYIPIKTCTQLKLF